MSYHHQYYNNGADPYSDGSYNYGAYTSGQQAYHDPYGQYSAQNPSYPPAREDAYSPYDSAGTGGGYGSQQTIGGEKKEVYGNVGKAESSTAFPNAEQDEVPRRRDPHGLTATPTRGSVAAQMAAEGTIPEKAGLRMWRSDEHAGTFTRGGKGRTCLRCCCCTVMVVIILIIGIVAAFLLWVRPPNVQFNGIEPPASGSEVNLINGGFQINFNLNIGVLNPNFFGAKFPSISAKAFYPSNKTTPLGGGTMNNIDIKSHSNTTIHFPFMVNYTTALDPNHVILTDLATKCGIIGTSSSQITVDYTLELAIKIIVITITPSFSSTTSFACPLSKNDIASVLGVNPNDLSGALGAISGSLGGGTKRSLPELEAPSHLIPRDTAGSERYVEFAKRLTDFIRRRRV